MSIATLHTVAAGNIKAGGGVAAAGNKPRCISITSNLKQQGKKKHENKPLSCTSTIHPSEILASRVSLEMAIAGLERLFLQSGNYPPHDLGFGFHRRPIRVAYQGVPGSYCHEAAIASFSSAVDAFASGVHMEDAFSVLESGSADRAIIPSENSIDGPIDRNLDLLLRHPDVRITGEIIVPVNHCLLASPSVAISDLRCVVSHPQALGHCERRIRSLDLEIQEVADAAAAARAVAEDRISDTAVIGSRMAAKEFGLRVLEPSFQDVEGNYNRFLQLGVDIGPASGGVAGDVGGNGTWKTTVAFSLEQGVSGLFEAMWIFNSRGVRVTKVDHRPNRANPVRVVSRSGEAGVLQFDYIFVVDLEGRETDSGVAAAIGRLGETSGFVRVLGSYACTTSAGGEI